MLDRRETIEKWPARTGMRRRGWAIFALGAVAGWAASQLLPQALGPQAAVAYQAQNPPRDLNSLSADVDRALAAMPGQSHAMVDVGHHFSNLWFAGESANWDLAKFLAHETRSHLRWSIRMKPVRKDSKGKDVDMKKLLQTLEDKELNALDEAIAAKDTNAFERTYGAALTGCYECHKAVAMPFLRMQVPVTAQSEILNFEPAASQ